MASVLTEFDADVIAASEVGGAAMAATVQLWALLQAQYVPLLLVFSIGVAMIFARYLLFLTAPWLSTHAGIACAVANLVLLFCQSAWEFFLILENVLSDVVSGVGDLVDAVPGVDVDMPKIPKAKVSFEHFYTINKHATQSWLEHVSADCEPYDDAYTVISHTVRFYAHTGTCAVVRYVTPVPWVGSAATYLLSDFYAGSAEPVQSHDHDDANCVHTINDDHLISPSCVVLGMGYVVLELVLPIMLGVVVLAAYGGFLWTTLRFLHHNILVRARKAVWRVAVRLTNTF